MMQLRLTTILSGSEVGGVLRLPVLLRSFPTDVATHLLTQKIFVPFDFGDFFRSSLDRPFHHNLYIRPLSAHACEKTAEHPLSTSSIALI